VRHVWKSFEGFIGNVLSQVSLADIAAGDIDLSKAMEAAIPRKQTSKET
jgi:hypothetical protein